MSICYDIEKPLVISSGILQGAPLAARETGIDLRAALRANGISRPRSALTSGYLPLHQLVGFLNMASEQAGCDHFGFLVAKHQTPLSFSVIARLSSCAENLEQAILDSLQFAELNSEYCQWELVTENDCAMLVRRPRVHYDAPLSQLQGLAITLAYKSLLALSGARLKVQQVSFSHARPANSRAFEYYFNAPVVFDQPNDMIVFSADQLQLSVPTADPQHHALMTRQLQARCAFKNEGGEGENIVTKVLDHMRRDLNFNGSDLDTVSQALELHPRSLQRELADHGLTFRQLLVRTRQEVAQQYLRDSNIPLVQIADILGYQNASAFTRAFKKQTGLSPSQWRASAGATR